ncbi:shikimate kinase [Corynebacterium sp. H128]|uniref:shikimate kinase n=1 Tax=unclassified Corynebacterium TaxID=2624378 RepID=UPI0030AE4DBA
MTSLVLVGPPGAGKSTIGRRLARALNVELVDTDALIEQQLGKSCGEIFTELGEAEFRRVEESVVAAALQHNAVISLGGGAVLSQQTRDLLAECEVIWLDVSVAEGLKRTSGEATRPVLHAADREARYREILDSRRPLYQEVATFKARTSDSTPQKIVTEILSYLENQ